MGIERLNEFWPEWKIIGELGEGSFGKVYKAVDEEAGFKAYSAIKVLSIPSSKAELDALLSDGMSKADSKAYFKEIVDDFSTEIKLMHALKGAPNIVGVEAFKIAEKRDSIGWDIFIRMELLRSFKEYINDRTPREDEIIRLGTDICCALEICAKKKIIHRDIKPANIFIDEFGNFKLGDFGIAKELEKTASAASAKGTLSYMAPEVVKGERYDSAVDIYSLGLVLYSLCNNSCPPFVDAVNAGYNKRKEAIDRRMAGEQLPPPVNASAELAKVILAACAYDPKQRFGSPTAFKNALLCCKNGKDAPMPANSDIPASDINKTLSVRKNEASNLTVVVRNPQIKEKTNNSNPSANAKKKKPIKGIIAVLAAALLLIAGVVGYINFKDYKSKQKDLKELKATVTLPVTEENIEENIDWNISEDGLKWYLDDDGTLTISGKGKMQDYNSDTDTAPWKAKKEFIKKVIIENGVENIGDNAFSYCDSLTSITISNSVTSIGYDAFERCSSLTEADIPNSVETIDNGAFIHCTALTAITIPDSVTTIGSYAFGYCSSLSEVTIPDSVTCISYNMFEYCTSLTRVTIPDSVTSICNLAFYYCTLLENITIPDSVATIGDSAFYYCTSLKNVNIGAYVTSIGKMAFYHCTALENLTIPDSVTSIGYGAFEYCTALTSIIIPDSVTDLGVYAFYYCTALKSVIIPDSVTAIGYHTFYYCTALTSVTIPDSVTSIGYYAFYSCTSLTEVVIPDSVTNIVWDAFSNCNKLTIKCSSGSYAEKFAIERHIDYITE